MSDNELIAEFMGYEKQGTSYFIADLPHIHASCIIAPKFLNFHRSWDWLMPVVEKISMMSTGDDDFFYPRTFGMRDADGNYLFRFNRMPLYTAKSFIEVVHAAVVEFIKWH